MKQAMNAKTVGFGVGGRDFCLRHEGCGIEFRDQKGRMDGMKESNIRKRIKRNVFENGQEISQFPKNMLMELTNLCNDSCLFCANSKCTRTRRTIEPELAERIIKEAYDLGTRELGFYQT